jgi:hypothetical protein
MSRLAATIAAQRGPQTEFLRSPADICIYGGAAGGGKTVGLILEPLRYATRVANFTAVFFRRSTPQITNPGGLWDESQNFYPRLGGIPHVGMREWRWPRAGRIKFSHLQFDSTVYAWQGAQIALICFDELTHFTAHQFFYMVSRNRSTCGVRPYIRATCNPDADSWVADFLAWWIDPESGLAIPERAGVLRYYVRVAEKTIWADRPEELVQYLPQPEDLPPSLEPPRPISVSPLPAPISVLAPLSESSRSCAPRASNVLPLPPDASSVSTPLVALRSVFAVPLTAASVMPRSVSAVLLPLTPAVPLPRLTTASTAAA